MNPLHEAVEDTFRTQKVRVFARDGAEYVGFLDRMDWNQRHVLLHGATRDGTHVGAAYISHAERIERVTPYRVEELDVDQIMWSPYAVKQFDPEQNLDYIRQTQEHGAIKSYPLVYTNESGVCEVIDGHKALWVCTVAGVQTQPCRIIDCSKRDALERFAWDHLPLANDVENDRTKYTDEEIRGSILRMALQFDTDTLYDIYPIRYNIQRLPVTELLEGDTDAG